ncbi:MAG: alpha/beta hydrolase family protein [Planctomycetaceae bacterium]
MRVSLRGALSLWPVLLLLALGASFAGRLSAADSKPKKGPRDVTVQTKDRVTLDLTYYEGALGKETPVVVLLHMKDGNRFIWQNDGGFAPQLHDQGFAVITADLRGHGQSKGGAGGANVNQPDPKKKKGSKRTGGADLKPTDYQAMIDFDLPAIKKFIYDEHQAGNLNMNKMAIVGPEMGATLAAFFAAADWAEPPYPDGPPGSETPNGQDVRALVLISPQNSFHGLPLPKAISDLRAPQYRVAFMFCVGEDDADDKGQAKKLYEQVKAVEGKEQRAYFQQYPGKLHGTEMLRQPNRKLEGHMLTFLTKHLRDLEPSWRDRESRLKRKD